MMKNGMKGKVVAITGASSGIGEATALELARRGAKVVLGARRLERLQDIATRIKDEGGEAVYAVTDVKSRADLINLVQVACEQFRRLDVIVNNAGMAHNIVFFNPNIPVSCQLCFFGYRLLHPRSSSSQRRHHESPPNFYWAQCRDDREINK